MRRILIKLIAVLGLLLAPAARADIPAHLCGKAGGFWDRWTQTCTVTEQSCTQLQGVWNSGTSTCTRTATPHKSA